MDAISLAIIVTVLSLGSALIYMFKLFEKRFDAPSRQSACNNSTNARKDNKSHQPHSSKNSQTQNSGTKQAVIATPTYDDSSAPAPSTNLKSSAVSNTLSQINGGKSAGGPKQVTSQFKTIKKKKFETQNVKNITLENHETSADELDSAIILSSFGSMGLEHSKIVANKSDSNQTTSQKKKVSKKKTNNLENNHSPERLFAEIAACNLTKEEVEIAVETLLNKLDSGESNWRQPKNDPLQKIKNQLRDSEAALSSEIQNHESTRALVNELKLQLQSEKSGSVSTKEECLRLRKDLGAMALVLEQTRLDLSKQHGIQQKIKDESSKIIAKLEQDKVQLQTKLAGNNGKEAETKNLRNELEEKIGQIQRYELSSQTMSEKIKELEAKLRSSEIQIDQIRSSKQHDDYEACARIAELESDHIRLDKALKDHIVKMNEMSAANKLLEKSITELQLINNRQEDMIKRQKDEREISETSMKRTLCEMELELKDLESKLSAGSITDGQNLKKDEDLREAQHRELKMLSEMDELRRGLAALLPELNTRELHIRNEDWVQQYLAAVKQLAMTVEELRNSSNNHVTSINNDCNGNTSRSESPQSYRNQSNKLDRNSNRIGSPTSNGRASKAESHKSYSSDKKVMETKLLELTDYIEELETKIREFEEAGPLNRQSYEEQSKTHAMQRSKLEAQIKFGLDSLRMEHAKVRELEEKLSKYTSIDCD